ncbi:MAG: zinc ABC transporter substrate-binding protein [Treponema sp.]|nr:zinc ABC transporter substrate-binding protein [Treponema sp.]
MKLHKFFAVAVTIAAVGVVFISAKKPSAEKESNKIKVVTTIFPEYDWARQIVGNNDGVDLNLLIANGVDLHSYSPSVADITKISMADVFVYVGGESDEWVEDVLKNSKNKDIKTVNLMEIMGDKALVEELVEGMEHEHDENDKHHHHDEHHHDEDDNDEDDHEGHHHDEDEEELDEHVWLSLRNAQILCTAICEAICEKDPANAVSYKVNLTAYNNKLAELDSKYSSVVKSGKRDTLLFGDRFPFRYMVEDYNLKYYAAFTGCSAESEASFKTIAFLANKVNELDLPCVCQIESGKGKIAKTIISTSKNKKAKVLTLDSMQSTTSKQIKKGTTYLNIMEKNLEVLKEALN